MIRGCANFDRDSKPKRKPTIGKQMVILCYLIEMELFNPSLLFLYSDSIFARLDAQIDDLGAAVKAAGDAKQVEVYTRLSGILQRQGLISDEVIFNFSMW